jgi:hypothetical protein
MGQSTWDKRFPNNKPIENLRSGPQGQKGKFRSTTSAANGKKKVCVGGVGGWVGLGTKYREPNRNIRFRVFGNRSTELNTETESNLPKIPEI